MGRSARAAAILIAAAILGWQAANATRGAFVHPFLIADLIAAGLLIFAAARPGRRGEAALLGAFAATGGVFLAASTAAILRDGFTVGRLAAGLGIVPCAAFAFALGRRLP